MPYRIIFTVLLGFGLSMKGWAQETVIRYFHPILSPPITNSAMGVKGAIRALVVGVGQYQNTGLVEPAYARRDAEAFAAFLKTPGGGSVPGEDLTLLTNEQATLARVSDALDAMVEQSRQGDKIVVYYTGAGKMLERGDARLLLYDSPAAPTDAGYLALSRVSALLADLAVRKGVRVLMAVEFLPVNPGEIQTDDWAASRKRSELYTRRFTPGVLVRQEDSTAQQRTFGNALLYGLLGLADVDRDEKVYTTELIAYLQASVADRFQAASCALLAVTSEEDWVCNIHQYTQDKMAVEAGSLFSPILHLEVQPLDDFMTQHADAHTRQFYEDFILAIRLEQLLLPPGRCAADLLDSLLAADAVAPVRKQLLRRMAVGYQDVAQQALNAYLQTNAQELARRRKNREHYKLYPQYMQRTLNILGPNHFMAALLEAKRLYFEGLGLRLEFEQTLDTALLSNAMGKLWQAIALEPEAAFVYNEMGVASLLMNNLKAAENYFQQALEYAPSWGVPQANLSLTYNKQGRVDEAVDAGYTAIQLSPWNAGAYVRLGEAHQVKGDMKSAETLYRRALRLDPGSPNAYYDLACLQAQTRQPAAAIESLRQAILNGYDRVEYLLEDPDLEPLHHLDAFDALIQQYFPEIRK